MKTLAFAVLASLTASLATYSPLASATGQVAKINIVDRSTGQALPVHYHRGEYWVAGIPGNKYAIEIINQHSGRILAVTSVDGVNVVSGQTAATAQGGYVFGGGQRYEITGWRKTDSTVAAFEFTASPNSYAEQTGRPRDVGVIGVALFKEKVVERTRDFTPQNSNEPRKPMSVPPPASPAPAPLPAPVSAAPPPPIAPTAQPASPSVPLSSSTPPASESTNSGVSARSSADSAESKSARLAPPQAAAKLGTAHGEREHSQVSRTQFDRATENPVEIIRIRYDAYANLVAMGVIRADPSANHRPNPFPDNTLGYVPDPRR